MEEDQRTFTTALFAVTGSRWELTRLPKPRVSLDEQVKQNSDPKTGMCGHVLQCPDRKCAGTEFVMVQTFSQGLDSVTFVCTECHERYDYSDLDLGPKEEED